MNQKVMNMARFRIRKLAEQQGIKNATELQKAANIAYSLARDLWREKDLNIESNTLVQIAAALNVRLSDLFDDAPEGK